MSNQSDGACERLARANLLHWVFSAGGSRAILGGAGAIVAIEQAELEWVSIGGVSGGSIPAVMYAAGFTAKETLRMALDIDFSSKLTRHGSILQILFAYFMQGRFERTRPRKGVLSSEKLGEYIEQLISERIGQNSEKLANWPKGYWTMASVGNNRILFTDRGVFEITPDGVINVLCDKPGPLGIAIRGTAAVPGIISAVHWKGRYLFDGALTPDGRCPIEIPIAHMGASEPTVIAVDVGDDGSKLADYVLKFWSIICGGDCVPDFKEKELTSHNGMVVIAPELTQFRSLQFTLTRDQKWQAVMVSYISAVDALKKSGHLTGQKLADAEAIVAAYAKIKERYGESDNGEFTAQVESLLSGYNLF